MSATTARVALVGNPNTGKTTLFNRLCGARAKTSNFPGTTTTSRIGRSPIGDAGTLEIVDLPGLYGLRPETPEGRLAIDVLEGAGEHPPLDLVIVLVDASNLTRSLRLVAELLSRAKPIVIALNMTDIALRRGVVIDAAALANATGAPVVPMVASRGEGVDGVRVAAAEVARRASQGPLPHPSIPDPVAWVAATIARVTSTRQVEVAPLDRLAHRLDRWLMHPVIGTLVFLAVMGGLFWALFFLAKIPMDLIEGTFAYLGGWVRQIMPDGPVRALLTDGVIGGIAGTAVFLPQICLLFFLISLMEDTGYLVRAAYVNDRFFRKFGLPGQAFVPLLTSHACALPGIMSTRLIADRRDRLAAIIIAPFMSCSARLPVYVLLTGLLFADRPLLGGMAFAGCYLIGAGAAFVSALLFSKTILKGTPRPMVLELPSYQIPSLRNALITAKEQGAAFLKTAGTVIMAICIVMWWLSAYPKVAPPPEAGALRAEAAQAGVAPGQSAALAARADAIEARAQEAGSIVGRAGRFIEPVFRPLGYDWQLTVGILTSFLAREVFVSTMSVLAGDSDQNLGVLDRVQTMTRTDGTPVFTPATAASALIFFVLAMQCLPTLTVTRREAGGIKYALFQLGYMSALAYVAALTVYQTLRLFGVS